MDSTTTASRPRTAYHESQNILDAGAARIRATGIACRVFAPSLLRFFFVACLLFISVSSVSGQSFDSFGTGKKKITMQRRLPAAVHFEGTAIDVRAKARDSAQADVAQRLGELLPTDLQHENTKLHEDKNAPDLRISCTVTSLDIPERKTFTQNDVAVQKSVEKQQKYYKVVGTLTVAYQASDRAGKTVDSRTITAKYSEDFNADTNTSANQSLPSKMINPFKRMVGKKTESATAPDADELKTILITRAVNQIVARLVNTNETIEVFLARGKALDKADKFAESGLWQKYNEALETMQPFPDPTVDAYRLYDIGVSDEAQAYQSEDHEQAKKFLDEAAINYGKALDAKPAEKYFLEPQNRIETGIEHYRALELSNEPPPPAHAEAPAQPASVSAASSPAAGAKSSTPHAAAGTSKSAAPSAGSSSGSPALTNEGVIKMVKAELDENEIISSIQDAKSVKFDLSPDGLIQLKTNGVSTKVRTAMQDRARRSTMHKSPSNSN